MPRILGLALLFALFAPTRTALAQPIADSSAALDRGREVGRWLNAGETGRMWSVMTPEMRAAMKDSASFASTTAGMLLQLGTIDSTLTESATGASDGWSYRALVRFSKSPEPLRFMVAFSGEGHIAGMGVRPPEKRREAPSAHLDYQTRTTLRLPFEGQWFVFWGGRTLEQNHHASIRAQRFAVDAVIRRDGRTHQRDGKALTDYHCYGAPILAPASGTVVWVADGHPDQPIGSTDAANPIGNGLVLDHGNGEFSLFAHLQPGTQKYKRGDRVADDARLGLCGNSGNTSEPHLHYQLQSGPDPVDSDGLPAFFTELLVDGAASARSELLRGQQVQRAPKAPKR